MHPNEVFRRYGSGGVSNCLAPSLRRCTDPGVLARLLGGTTAHPPSSPRTFLLPGARWWRLSAHVQARLKPLEGDFELVDPCKAEANPRKGREYSQEEMNPQEWPEGTAPGGGLGMHNGSRKEGLKCERACGGIRYTAGELGDGVSG